MKQKHFRILALFFIMILTVSSIALPVFAATPGVGEVSGGPGDFSGAIENTWNSAKGQIQAIVNNVIFPIIDTILVVMFFVKLGTVYFDYRKFGRFEFAGPCIIFGCLIFTLTAPLYIWSIL